MDKENCTDALKEIYDKQGNKRLNIIGILKFQPSFLNLKDIVLSIQEINLISSYFQKKNYKSCTCFIKGCLIIGNDECLKLYNCQIENCDIYGVNVIGDFKGGKSYVLNNNIFSDEKKYLKEKFVYYNYKKNQNKINRFNLMEI